MEPLLVSSGADAEKPHAKQGLNPAERTQTGSVELSRTIIFSVLFSLFQLALFNFTWPALPPIVIVPFLSSGFLALTLPFSRNQWAMGLVASMVTIVSKGAVLPGPFIIPVYGIIFQSRRAELSGAVTSSLHVVYSLFLAPVVFAAAPGKVLYSWLMAYSGSLVVAVATVMALFAVGGILSARAGRRVGERISISIRKRGYVVYDY